MVWAFTIFLFLSLLAGIVMLAREAGKSQALLDEETDDLQGVINAQKKTIEQDRAVASRMCANLSAALRRKRDS
jgi:hypothetical protein